MFAVDDAPEVNEQAPGRLCLRLEPQRRVLRVVTPDGGVLGTIHHEGILPYRRKVMRNASGTVWTLTVRSLVRNRHRLQIGDGETLIVETPFYWWQPLTAGPRFDRKPGLVGMVGPTKAFWKMWIEPGRDRLDLLAAMACLHRQWWRL